MRAAALGQACADIEVRVFWEYAAGVSERKVWGGCRVGLCGGVAEETDIATKRWASVVAVVVSSRRKVEAWRQW